MCGVSGFVEKRGASAPSRELLRRMLDAIAHRGPDGDGLFVDGPCALGHVRLAIVDLGGGAQPMTHEALTITFNGEVFNFVELRAELEALGHTFRTTSDTEVILHAYAQWGADCVPRLNGDFAFAIWDARAHTLFCARDRVGVRPFFYTDTPERFVFGSEVKALFAAGVPAAPDAHGLVEVLTFWSARAPRTVWRDVRELPPGCTLTLKDGAAVVSRYFTLDYPSEPAHADPARDAADAEELRALLDDATRIRLRADVPVGAYLSGGLDSSLVTALAARRVPRLHTFSLMFEEKALDERAFQLETAAAIGTSHRAMEMKNADVAQAFVRTVHHAETPLLRTAAAPLMHLAADVRTAGMKVVLTGEGADEMFGGYDIFKEAKIRRFCARQPQSALRPRLLQRMYPWMPQLKSQPPAYLRAFFSIADADDPLFSHLPRFKLAAQLRGVLARDVAASVKDFDPLQQLRDELPARFRAWDPFAQAQYLEASIFLPGYLLSSQGDRVAMAHAVEARFPYLDPRVIDRAARMPIRQKMRVLDEKHLLKRAARGLVPASVLERPKQPYRAPDARSLVEAPALLDELLAPARVRSAGILDDAVVAKLVERVRRSNGDVSAKDGMALCFAVSTQVCADRFMGGEQS